MTNEPLSESVRLLLREHMTTFERLEALLYLRKHAADEHTAKSVSDRLGVPPELTSEALAGLTASGLVARGHGNGTFRFAPATPELANAAEGLATAYREQSAAVLSAMSMYAIERIRSGPMRAFADSFVLGTKKGKDDG
jgi:DNA-binding IclR family transcriptional regulator